MRWLLACLALLSACNSTTPKRKSVSDVSRSPRDSSGAQTSAVGGQAARTSRPVIVFAGTSLTAGLGLDPDSAYPQLIQRKIDSAGLWYDVVNAGVSGETSAGLLRRLDWLLRQPFDVIVIETGANDGLRGTPVEEAKSNIRSIIERVKATHPQARVLLVQMEAPPNFGHRYTQSFHDMYPSLATSTGVTLLPFLLNGVAGHIDLNQSDGMHPNNRGERIVADNVWRGLEPVLRGAQPR